jgi:mono/diheme cytochrome c family protein
LKNIFAIVLIFVTAAATADDIDKRRVLHLTEHQRDHVLAEMRALLSGTQKILDALHKEDMAAIAAHARSLGMGMAHKGEDHLKSVLPREFMQLGMSVHKAFDQIAADAEALKDPRHTLLQLSESMKNCVACHNSYQIHIQEQPATQRTYPPNHRHDY